VQLEPILNSISKFHDPLLLDNFYKSLQLDGNSLPAELLEDAMVCIENTYTFLVKALERSADHCIPINIKFKAKFWWDDLMNILKKNSMESFKIWCAAGKPDTGPLLDQKKDKWLFKSRIKENKNMEKNSV